jgi:hypothetical protein
MQVFDDIKQELITWETQMFLAFLKELKLDTLMGEGRYLPHRPPTPSPTGVPMMSGFHLQQGILTCI